MKVKDLIKLLQDEDQEAMVRFGYNYGDRHHTIVTPEVNNVEQAMTAHSDYFRMHSLVTDGGDGDGDGDAARPKPCVLLT